MTTPITGSTIPMGLALNTPGAGTGQTYYVATTGSDSNNGLNHPHHRQHHPHGACLEHPGRRHRPDVLCRDDRLGQQ
ncbi:hypothetical protein [Acidiferrobacter sp. SPIII_3]|uniref:hypothetical protein n=1 Tax=Acidiferrobacter sp. SPIII_3 TaxID=1281578 RepID=UPI0011AB7728|nr:hypothetical protein [Acidiferrobacter sp. SPIII_3]